MSAGIDEALHAIKQIADSYDERLTDLSEENKKLRDEHYKDAELADMKRQLDSFKEDHYRGFPLTKQEEEKINKWKKEHDTSEHDNPSGMHGVSGGGFAYIFYPTAIGCTIQCRCNHCHEIAMSAAVNVGDRKYYNEYMNKHDAIIEINDY